MRYGELLLKGEAKELYQGILSQANKPLKLKLQVRISFSKLVTLLIRLSVALAGVNTKSMPKPHWFDVQAPHRRQGDLQENGTNFCPFWCCCVDTCLVVSYCSVAMVTSLPFGMFAALFCCCLYGNHPLVLFKKCRFVFTIFAEGE